MQFCSIGLHEWHSLSKWAISITAARFGIVVIDRIRITNPRAHIILLSVGLPTANCSANNADSIYWLRPVYDHRSAAEGHLAITQTVCCKWKW